MIEKGFSRAVPLDQLPGWDAVMGLQFENLVLNNISELAPLIGLVGKNVESAAPYFRSGRKTGLGVQVDYLVQLPSCVYVIEIKRMRRIGKSVQDEVCQKIERLNLPRSKSVRTVLVYDGELDVSVEEDGFFDYLISAEQLFHLSK